MEAALANVYMSQESNDVHRSLTRAEKLHSEAEVTRLTNTFDQFLNPFKTDNNKDQPLCLSSEIPARQNCNQFVKV